MALKIEEQLAKGLLTHLMELELYNITQYGENGYRCALCELGVIAKDLRKARKVAEFTYGKCPQGNQRLN